MHAISDYPDIFNISHAYYINICHCWCIGERTVWVCWFGIAYKKTSILLSNTIMYSHILKTKTHEKFWN